MKNIFDIRKDENLYWILPDNYVERNIDFLNTSIAVFAYLYYSNTLSNNIETLNRLDKNIDIYIISSDEKILSLSKKLIKPGKNKFFLLKENRGRDVSALLVNARKYIKKYKYFCFIHDKRVKKREERGDVEFWISSLWENMLSSNEYVNNIIGLFENNEKIGILAPPEPIGEMIYSWYYNSWDLNYENMRKLKHEFDLNCNLNRQKAPITIGTVFWARTEALVKLFNKDWKYNDFPGEPFPDDGSISHAIERCFGFFAQDAGFHTGTVMTSSYASKLINKSQTYMKEVFEYLDFTAGIKNIFYLRQTMKIKKRNSVLLKHKDNIYVYGAGKVAQNVLIQLFKLGLMPKKIIVSESNNIDSLFGIPIEVFSDPSEYKKGLIVIGVGKRYRTEVVSILEQNKLRNYISIF